MPEGTTRRIGLKEALAAGIIALAVAFLWHTSTGATSSPVRAAGARKALSQLQATSLDGKPWKLSDYRGQVVLVNFWATWCPPCRMETPGLVRLSNAYRGRGLVVVGISMDEGGVEGVRNFVRNYGIPYPVVIPPADSPLAGGIDSLPTTLLIDKKGRVAKTYYGAESEQAFRADVEALLAES